MTEHQHETSHIRTYIMDLTTKAAFEIGPERLKAVIVISALGAHARLIPFGVVPYAHEI
jgi:hypothetical protein